MKPSEKINISVFETIKGKPDINPQNAFIGCILGYLDEQYELQIKSNSMLRGTPPAPKKGAIKKTKKVVAKKK